MSESFKVGDHVEVIYVPSIFYSYTLPGWRGVVTAPLYRNEFGYDVHQVEFDNGQRTPIIRECLRKIDDGDDKESLDSVEPLKVVRWTDCPWRPAGVRA